MIGFSKRTAWDSRESSYAAAVRALRASGRRVYDLAVSNPTRCGFRYDAEELLAPLQDHRSMIYDPDPSGIRSSREAVAEYYADHQANVDPDQLVLTTSTSESYSYLFRLLCDPGDEVLVAQPSYPLFDFLADLDDVRLKPYPLFYDHGWWIDFAELERAITPRTRAVIVVNPNNPTGHWTLGKERLELEALCGRHQLALIVDEVFLDYALTDADEARSFASGDQPVLTFVLSGLSKICGLPQMKAAWIATMGPEENRKRAQARLEIVADTFLSMSAPIQLATPFWLRGRRAIQAQILGRARENLALLRKVADLEPGQIEILRTDAGWSAVLSLAACVGEIECAERLATERGVVVHPGKLYGMSDCRRVVVSLIGPVCDMEQGIQRAILPVSTGGKSGCIG